jgi:hypothetical protein
MSASWRPDAERLVNDLRSIFGERLQSVVAYGSRVEGAAEAPLRCLALVKSLSASDLAACAGKARGWQKSGLGIPLILPSEEFRRSLDAFPLEYGEIIRGHERVYGDDPFLGVEVARDDLRRACETQIKSHLIHLREGFIQSGGQPAAVAELVTASAPAFAALLRQVARLVDGAAVSDRRQATHRGARAASLPDGLVADILSLDEAGSMPSADPARLFPDYLAAIEQLSRTVDAWRA